MKRLIATLLIFAFTAMPENSMSADVKSSVEAPESKLETITHQIGQRRYHVRTPPSWDARSPLPVLLHFHGWGRNGQQVLRNRRIADAAAQHGFLLLAPDARGRSFDFWASDSEDIAFTDDMVEDLADRYPIDESSILVSGFSWGGAMAWRIACERGPKFRAYLPIAGHLYRQNGEDCRSGNINIIHVHGLRDTVVDPVPGTQEEPWRAVSLWHKVNRCRVPNRSTWQSGAFNCHQWNCRSNTITRVCLHDGGHVIPKGWLQMVLAEFG